MTLGKELRREEKLKDRVNVELSKAVGQVLKKYGITGDYIFNVRRDADYGHKQIGFMNGRRLIIPIYCVGSGCVTVENPDRITAI